MKKAYVLLSAIATMEKRTQAFEKLGWQAFQGTVAEYDALKDELSKAAPGIDGYKKFAKNHAGGDMEKGYRLLSAIATMEKREEDFEKLGWQQFPGTVAEYDALKDELSKAAPGIDGYKKFAKNHAGGDMEKGYRLLSAIATMEKREEDFEKLGWQVFLATVTKYESLNEKDMYVSQD